MCGRDTTRGDREAALGTIFSFVFFPKERLSLSRAAPAGLITRLPDPIPGRPGRHGWMPCQEDPQLVRPPAASRPVFPSCLREERPPLENGTAPQNVRQCHLRGRAASSALSWTWWVSLER